jgi:preprotein translocase subunit SecG
MIEVILVIHLLIALALIGVVLLQRSEGGALGIGGGGAGSMFSSRGVGNTLTRTTAILAVIFFITSISLTILARSNRAPSSVFDGTRTEQPAGQQGQQGQQGQRSESQGQAAEPPAQRQTAPTTPQVPTGQ